MALTLSGTTVIGGVSYNINIVLTISPAVVAPPPPPPPPAPPPAPPPPATATVQINGSSSAATVASGAKITAAVANGPGNPGDWLGVYLIGSASGPANPASWAWLSTDNEAGSPPSFGVRTGTVHLVVPPVAGQYEVRLFLANSFNVGARSAAITVQAAAAPPPPPPPPAAPPPAPAPTLVMSFSPSTPAVPDNAPAGAFVANVLLAWSDGTPYSGGTPTITSSNPSFVTAVGMQLKTARAMTPSDDTVAGKPDILTITATTPTGQSAIARLVF